MTDEVTIAARLADLRVVLVETSHPGNIGAAARAMKTMGLSELALVKPKVFPSAEATAMASGADDLLTRATVYPTLDAALADCHLVMGASARPRSLAWPIVGAREAATRAIGACASGKVAMVFGRERTGLSNDEMERCQLLLNVPANPDYSSLNLAMAVQVVAYELRVAAGAKVAIAETGTRRATAEELARYYTHLEAVLLLTGFLNPANPRHLMRRLKRVFHRADLDASEVNMLRGVLSSVEELQTPRRPGGGAETTEGKEELG